MDVWFDHSTNHWRIPNSIESFLLHELIIPWINSTVTVKSQNMWNLEDQWLWLTSVKEKRRYASMKVISVNCNRSTVGSETVNNQRFGKIELQKPTLEKLEGGAAFRYPHMERKLWVTKLRKFDCESRKTRIPLSAKLWKRTYIMKLVEGVLRNGASRKSLVERLSFKREELWNKDCGRGFWSVFRIIKITLGLLAFICH